GYGSLYCRRVTLRWSAHFKSSLCASCHRTEIFVLNRPDQGLLPKGMARRYGFLQNSGRSFDPRRRANFCPPPLMVPFVVVKIPQCNRTVKRLTCLQTNNRTNKHRALVTDI